MAVRELTTTANVTFQEGSPIAVREFHCHPYQVEGDVWELIGAANGLPAKMSQYLSGGLQVGLYAGMRDIYRLFAYDYAIRPDPSVPQAWLVTVTYRRRGEEASISSTRAIAPNDDGYLSIRLDTNVVHRDEWRQYKYFSEFEAALERTCDADYVPKYSLNQAESDIGGTKIDTAGYPTTVLRPEGRLLIELTSSQRIDPVKSTPLLGSRNKTKFANYDRGTLVYGGHSTVELPTGMYQHTLTFAFDQMYHLKQIPQRQANGYVVLDLPSNPNDQMATGQAKRVAFVQPYPMMSFFEQIDFRLGRLR